MNIDSHFLICHMAKLLEASSIKKSEINLTSISYQSDMGVDMNWFMELAHGHLLK